MSTSTAPLSWARSGARTTIWIHRPAPGGRSHPWEALLVVPDEPAARD